MSQKKYNTAYTFSNITDLPENHKNIDISQNILVNNTRIIYSTINSSIDIRTKYSFCEYYYLKNKIALSLSSLINSVYFDTGCSVILYDIVFFYTQAFNTLI